LKNIGMKRLMKYVWLWFFVVIMVFPFIWLVSSSFKESRGIFATTFSLLPRDPDTGEISFTLNNYKAAFAYVSFGKYFANTLIVAVSNTIANLVFNAMAGYSFARLRFKGKGFMFNFILASMMIPATVMLVPNMIIINKLGLYGSLSALIVPFFMSVYNVFLMRQHFLSMPREIEESGIMDGASWYIIFWRIALPLARPLLVLLSIFTFMWNYNNFLWPLIVINDPDRYTLALGLGSLISATRSADMYPIMIAGSVIVALPLIILFLFLQKHIIKGINVGGVKG
jgi:ABC-type glycerol-3-phosphate transport system permease component